MTFQDIEVQKNHHIQIRNLITMIIFLNHQVDRIHHTHDPPIIRKKSNYNTHKTLSNNSRLQSPHCNRDGNRPRRPLFCNQFHNMRNKINSLLDQAQTEDTMSNTVNTETQSISKNIF